MQQWLICSDSFKDAATAAAVCDALEVGLQDSGVPLTTKCVPLSDGGGEDPSMPNIFGIKQQPPPGSASLKHQGFNACNLSNAMGESPLLLERVCCCTKRSVEVHKKFFWDLADRLPMTEDVAWLKRWDLNFWTLTVNLFCRQAQPSVGLQLSFLLSGIHGKMYSLLP